MNKGIGSVFDASSVTSWNSSTKISAPYTITPTKSTADSAASPIHSSPAGYKGDKSSAYSTHHNINILSDTDSNLSSARKNSSKRRSYEPQSLSLTATATVLTAKSTPPQQEIKKFKPISSSSRLDYFRHDGDEARSFISSKQDLGSVRSELTFEVVRAPVPTAER